MAKDWAGNRDMSVNPCQQTLLIAVWATLVLPWNSAAATTIVCPDMQLAESDWVAKHFREADVVLMGEVIAESRVSQSVPASEGGGEPLAVDSMQELLDVIAAQQAAASSARYFQSVSVNVLEQWKGPAMQIFEFRNPVQAGQIGWYLRKGQTYLLFAYRQADNTYTVRTICRETLDWANAQTRVTLLDDLTRRRSAPDPQ